MSNNGLKLEFQNACIRENYKNVVITSLINMMRVVFFYGFYPAEFENQG